MSMSRWARRGLMTGVGAVGALAFGISSASAHHCYVPMYSLNAPVSANWLVITAEDGAAFIAGYEAECDEAVQAGYDALRASNGPVAIKIFEHITIGQPKGEDSGSNNPNRANGRGLEDFADGSTLAMDMVGAWITAAMATDCS